MGYFSTPKSWFQGWVTPRKNCKKTPKNKGWKSCDTVSLTCCSMYIRYTYCTPFTLYNCTVPVLHLVQCRLYRCSYFANIYVETHIKYSLLIINTRNMCTDATHYNLSSAYCCILTTYIKFQIHIFLFRIDKK